MAGGDSWPLSGRRWRRWSSAIRGCCGIPRDVVEGAAALLTKLRAERRPFLEARPTGRRS
jgi:hypothetical protein